jgi:hypothetical protein
MKYVSILLCSAVAAAGITFAVVAQDHGQHDKSTPPAAASNARVGDAYPFDTCPITSKKLGSMGDPVVKLYDGREVRFCCPGCPPKFEADKAANLAKLDEKIAKDQGPLYPLKTSVVTGKQLPETPYEFVYGNRLVRLGAESEKAEFSKDAKRYMDDLDKAVIADQGKNYALKKCPVSGEEYGGEMGAPKDVVVAGRLIRQCCGDCKKDLDKNPAKYIGMVDAARHGHDADHDRHDDGHHDSGGNPHESH